MMMEKIGGSANAVNWFEIPVTDAARAQRFYETVLDVQMERRYMEETQEELVFFPFTPGVVRATSGKVSGALVKNDRVQPSANGTMVYLNASPSLADAVARVTAAGGKVLVAPMKIQAGLIAVINDTEGNRVGLHAME